MPILGGFFWTRRVGGVKIIPLKIFYERINKETNTQVNLKEKKMRIKNMDTIHCNVIVSVNLGKQGLKELKNIKLLSSVCDIFYINKQ